MEDDIYSVSSPAAGKVAEGGPKQIAAGAKITKDYLADIGRDKWFEIRLRNEDANADLEKAPISSRTCARSSRNVSRTSAQADHRR